MERALEPSGLGDPAQRSTIQAPTSVLADL